MKKNDFISFKSQNSFDYLIKNFIIANEKNNILILTTSEMRNFFEDKNKKIIEFIKDFSSTYIHDIKDIFSF